MEVPEAPDGGLPIGRGVALRELPIGRALLPIGFLGIPSALPDKGSVLTGGGREVDGRWTGGAREVDGRRTGKSPGEARRSQEPQERPGEARRGQERPGEARRGQERGLDGAL